MSANWTTRKICIAHTPWGEELLVATELGFYGPQGHVTVRRGRLNVWEHFQMTEVDYFAALTKQKIPVPAEFDDWVVVIGHSRFCGLHYAKERRLWECPPSMQQRMVEFGLITNHDLALSFANHLPSRVESRRDARSVN